MRPSTHLLRDGYRLVRPLLRRWDAGCAQEAVVDALGALGARRSAVESNPVTVADIRFPNRVGLASGIDRDGIAARAWAHLRFGFAELGTATAKPHTAGGTQELGFHNAGAEALAMRLRGYGIERGNRAVGIPFGVSIARSQAVAWPDAVDDLIHALQMVAPVADYVALTLAEPGAHRPTPLPDDGDLEDVLNALTREAEELDDLPIFVSVPSHVDATRRDELLRIISGAGAAGIIAGAPDERNAERAVGFVDAVASRVALPVVGLGGILTPRDAARMFDAGAQLIQLSTGLADEGPALVRGIHEWEGR